MTNYSDLVNNKHPWGNARIDSGKNPCKSIAVRFPMNLSCRNDQAFHRNPKAWRAYLVKELSKVDGGLDGMTL